MTAINRIQCQKKACFDLKNLLKKIEGGKSTQVRTNRNDLRIFRQIEVQTSMIGKFKIAVKKDSDPHDIVLEIRTGGQNLDIDLH